MRAGLAAVLFVCSTLPAQAQVRDTAKAHAFYIEGRSAMTDRRIDDAIKAFQNAIALEPTNSDYHLWLGNAHTRDLIAASFIRKAIVARRILPEYDKAVALDPKSIDAAEARLDFYLGAPSIVGGGMDKAKAEAARIKSLSAYSGFFAQAKVDEKAGDVAAAEADYRSALGAYPDSSQSTVRLGTFLLDRARYNDAFAVIDARLAAAPDDASATYLLGKAAALSGTELNRGAAALLKFLAMLGERDPLSRAAAHYRLGGIREKMGDKASARSEYDRALEINPRYDDAKAARKRIG